MGRDDRLTEYTVGETTIELIQGDITEQEVDAVVNAANSRLAGGGGVDGAIHRAGGPSIMAECDEIREAQGGCETGHAVKTTAGDLPAEMVIHAVGPVWHGGHKNEYVDLEGAYKRSLELAASEGARTIAFPSISTGAYGFPIDRAAPVALGTMVRFALENEGALDAIYMVLFSEDDFDAYAAELAEMVRTKMGT